MQSCQNASLRNMSLSSLVTLWVKKVAAVREWPVPKDKHDVSSFLGFGNYFRKFILGYSALVYALRRLQSKTAEFEWTAACQEAFDALKKSLCEAPVLALPDLDKRFEVICDACSFGLGAVLAQEGRPAAFESKALTPAETSYSVGEQELLTIVHACETWRCYLEDREFTVNTDHSPNTFFDTKPLIGGRLTRWAERLSKFAFIWQYRPGRLNVADPLSRLPSVTNSVICCSVGLTAATERAENLLADIRAGYAADPFLADTTLLETLSLVYFGGMYYKEAALVVPNVQSVKDRILQSLHDALYAGHVGGHRTVKNVSRLYWWPTWLEWLLKCASM